jgi:hypothetical protein
VRESGFIQGKQSSLSLGFSGLSDGNERTSLSMTLVLDELGVNL